MSSTNTIHFAAVGDVSFGDHPLCVGFGSHSTFKKRNAGFPFQHVIEDLQQAELLFGNLECTLSEAGRRSGDYHSIQMRGQQSDIDSLTQASFNVMNMANNHAMQHGKQPFKETVALLQQHNIQPCGVNYDDHLKGIPVITETNGIKVAFLGYSLRPRQYFEEAPLYTEGNYDNIVADTASAKQQADIVIVSLHWGEEFITRPAPEEIQLARATIDAGASLIVGHHPHVLRGMEHYKNGTILYSLGNFVCDMMWDESLRETAIFHCDIDKNGISNPRFTAAYINNSCQPTILTGEASSALLNKIAQRSEAAAQYSLENIETKSASYVEEADDILRIIRKKSQKYFLRKIWKYPPMVLIQQVLRYIYNRVHERIAAPSQ